MEMDWMMSSLVLPIMMMLEVMQVKQRSFPLVKTNIELAKQ